MIFSFPNLFSLFPHDKSRNAARHNGRKDRPWRYAERILELIEMFILGKRMISYANLRIIFGIWHQNKVIFVFWFRISIFAANTFRLNNLKRNFVNSKQYKRNRRSNRKSSRHTSRHYRSTFTIKPSLQNETS